MMMNKNFKRYHILDSIRGITIISMILYHLVWDLVYIFQKDFPWFMSKSAYTWQQSICSCFIFLSGFCFCFGKNKLKRGIDVFFWGLIISIVTIVLMPENTILFGVLTLLGSSMLIQIPLDKIFKKLNPILLFVVSIFIFVFTKNINGEVLGISGIFELNLPHSLYKNLFTAYLGFPPDNLYSADYFPLMPWYFLFLSGYSMYRLFEKYNLLNKIPNIKILPLEWLGRNSLTIYILHQPIIYFILMVLSEFKLL